MIKVRNLDDNQTAQHEPTKYELFKEFCCEPKTQQPVTATLPEPKPINNQDEKQIADQLKEQAKLAAKFGAKVSITGQWVWAGFNAIPAAEVRETLKANKWIWCKNKGKWAYRGVVSRSRKNMPWDYIISKYGEQKIEEETNA